MDKCDDFSIHKELYRLLLLKHLTNDNDDMIIWYGEELNKLWTLFILLDVNNYYNYCLKQFNKIINYNSRNYLKSKSMKRTQELYKEIYKENPNDTYWNEFVPLTIISNDIKDIYEEEENDEIEIYINNKKIKINKYTKCDDIINSFQYRMIINGKEIFGNETIMKYIKIYLIPTRKKYINDLHNTVILKEKCNEFI